MKTTHRALAQHRDPLTLWHRIFLFTAAGLLLSGTVSRAATHVVRVDPPNLFLQFSPEELRIEPGDTVQWVWDGRQHSVTSGDPETGTPNGLFDSGIRNTGATFTFTFGNPGIYPYYCAPHRQAGMTGRIIVGSSAPTPTPAPTPPSQPLNVSTRLRVQTGEGAMIGGFIITGDVAKKVIVRALGPSLARSGVDGALQDPTISLNGSGGLISRNDNWRDAQQAEIEAAQIAPTDDRESAIIATLQPGNYTALVEGKDSSTGVGLVEVYDLDQPASAKLANISTRGVVGTGSNVLIGGFILGRGAGEARVIVRALGPTLGDSGISGVLQDPELDLRDGNGTLISTNNDWKQSQAAEITGTGIPPKYDAEAAIVARLAPGAYTAIVRGRGDTTGIGLVEVYHLQ